MKTSEFYFDLPEELIAQEPLKDRSSSRLLVADKNTESISHRHFRDIKEYLKTGDCLVINDTRVLPARLHGERVGTGAHIEVLLLVRKSIDTWEVLVRPGKKARPGDMISFGDGRLTAEVLETIEGGNRIIKFYYEGVFENILDELGEMPLPPYITHKLEDKERYQTVYAKHDGSAAAPTAGLHFTPELLKEIEEMGVKIAHVTLHVGLGTFRPVKAEDILDHEMHSEYYVVEEDQAAIMNEARKNGGRIIAVGTTSTRTLESVIDENGIVHEGSGWTKIFIYPGYTFKAVDCMITNFHLPESTLIMLVSALMGKDFIMRVYEEAVKERYRFFSFGDACLFLTK
ncbi:MAG: tRNA preQ1(34) S-adenosylmethionine ribosyltransferase-isomerase QueA [Anaerotignum lactatifermentans]